MRELLIATSNKGKLAEIVAAFVGLPFTFLTLKDMPTVPEVEETEDTFEGNAVLKAKAYGAHFGMLTLADDSGLEVDALGGEPGVKSARYAPGSDEDRYRKLLQAMKDVPDDERTARMRCIAAVYDPHSDKTWTSAGTMELKIMREPRGTLGFGYDPVLFNMEAGKMHSEETPEDRNKTSHRGKALRKMREILLKEFV